MGAWFDRLILVVLNASLSAAAMLAVLGLGVVVCQQPARRLVLVRGLFLGLLVLIPLEVAGLSPKIEIGRLPDHLGLTALRATSTSPRDLDAWAEPVAPAPWAWWVRLLVGGYALGVTGALGWLALGYLALNRLARRSVSASPTALRLYAALPGGGTGLRPELRVAPGLRSPLLLGLSRPLILIPAAYDPPEPTPESCARLRLSLLHELAHHEARDPWFLLVGRLTHAFWFFVPPFGWVVDRMRLDQELIADRKAALGFGPIGDYAASLLDLAASTRPAGAGRGELLAEVVAEVGAGRLPEDPLGSPLVQRLRMLVRSPFPVEPSAPSAWSRVLPGLTALLTLGASSLAALPVSASRSLDATRPTGPARLFFLSDLKVAGSKAMPNGRAPRVELPIPLPLDYELRVEVRSTRDALLRMRIAGRALGSPADLKSSVRDAQPTWHRVRLRNWGQDARLWIDDQPHPLPTDCDPFPVWLTLESPPGLDGEFKNLRLLW